MSSVSSAEWIYEKGYKEGHHDGYRKGYTKGATVVRDDLTSLIKFCLSEGYLTSYDGIPERMSDETKARIIAENYMANKPLDKGLPQR